MGKSRTDSSSPADEICTLTNGADSTSFHVHRKILSKTSAFFQQSIHREPQRPYEVFHLSPYSNDALRIYTSWLYNRRLDLPSPSGINFDTGPGYWWSLIHSYRLAGDVADDHFQDEVASRIASDLGTRTIAAKIFPMVSTEIALYAYQHTPQGSPLRRILVERYSKSGAATLDHLRGQLPLDCIHDILVALAYHADNPQTSPVGIKSNSCEYHTHVFDLDDDTGEECPRRKER